MARKNKQVTSVRKPPVPDPKRAEYTPPDAKDRLSVRGEKRNPNEEPPAKDHVYGVASRARWGSGEPISELHRDSMDIDGSNARKPGSGSEEETVEPEKMTVAELKAELDAAGVEYASDAKKADLVEAYSGYLADNQD